MLNIFKLKFVYFLLSVLMTGCASYYTPKPSVIHMKGSNTMIILARMWAETYMKENPGVSIYVEGGGSALGIKALINGGVDICTSSRPMLAQEVQQLAEKHQKLGISFLIAKDALSVYLNINNPVKNLTLTQLKLIFTGEMTSWREVGGLDKPIMVYNRSPNSGTYLYFRQHVLNDIPYTQKMITVPTTLAVVEGVADNRNAIGYGGTGYGAEVYHCKINGIAPTIENVTNDLYPISRYLYLYTVDTPKGTIKNFIDWILDVPGQSIVTNAGYIPLWSDKNE